jgi:flagellin
VAASGNNLTFTANAAGTSFNLSNTTTSALFSTTANNVVAQQQVETVTIGADSTAAGGGQIAVGDQYSVTINGTAYTTTATAGQSASDLRAALLSLVNTDGASVVTASTGAAAGELVLTADVAGTGFTISQTATTSADSLSAATTTANVSPFSLGKSLKQLSEMMGFNGAEQSQLEAARDQLSQNQVHYQSAQSRIRDVDVARESAAFARSQIRLQAVQSLLMQANLVTDSVLQLLR